jgi:hypothetical protein
MSRRRGGHVLLEIVNEEMSHEKLFTAAGAAPHLPPPAKMLSWRADALRGRCCGDVLPDFPPSENRFLLLPPPASLLLPRCL